jgi:hypothetical protein
MNSPKHLLWIPIGAAVFFLASFMFGDLVTLPRDLYYLIYFVIVCSFFVVYIKKSNLHLQEFFNRRLLLGIILGVIVGALMVQMIYSRPEGDTLSGSLLVWAVFWRGLVYGAVDGLILFAFPWIVVWRSFHAEGKPLVAKIKYGLLAYVFVLLITTVYHLGYSDFRTKKIIQPNIGSTITCIPTLVSANPVASPLAHMAMHVAAVMHIPNSALFLPPHGQVQSETSL